jgi:hypothetical protein
MAGLVFVACEQQAPQTGVPSAATEIYGSKPRDGSPRHGGFPMKDRRRILEVTKPGEELVRLLSCDLYPRRAIEKPMRLVGGGVQVGAHAVVSPCWRIPRRA